MAVRDTWAEPKEVNCLVLPAAMFLTMICFTCGQSLAHSGGLNAEGCHTNRKTGDYHCHGGSSEQSTVKPSAPSRLFDSGDGAFANCSAARAAGVAPVMQGEPGYGPHLDRDNDGIGCE